MGAAKKLEMLPEEKYIQDRLRDGSCVRQDFSMKALGKPDAAYQARVDPLDIAHAKRFADQLRDGGSLWPVVVFTAMVGTRMRAILADGFHRHHAYASLKLPSIPAYVVTVPADRLEHEARLYASMCNQLATKGRTREDLGKAVEMLLADPECRAWADSVIATHCGVSCPTVVRYRNRFFARHGFPLPEYVVKANGQKTRYKKPRNTAPRVIVDSDGERAANFRGQRIHLPRDPDAAADRLDEVMSAFGSLRKQIYVDSIQRRLEYAGFSSERMPSKLANAHLSTKGCRVAGVAWTSARFDLTDTVPWAVGCVLTVRHLIGKPGDRAVVVCRPEDGPQASIELWREHGIEFLAPEELIESLNGE